MNTVVNIGVFENIALCKVYWQTITDILGAATKNDYHIMQDVTSAEEIKVG